MKGKNQILSHTRIGIELDTVIFFPLDLTAFIDRICGLVVRVPGNRYSYPGFDSRRYQIFWLVGLERVPLSLVRIIENYLKEKATAPV
jgi:hypothetical protein